MSEPTRRSLRESPASAAATAAPAGLAAAELFGSEQVAASAAAPRGSRPRFGKRYVTALLIGYGTLYLAWIAPTAFSLAIRVQQIDPVGKDAALAVAIGLPGVIVLLTGPVTGVLVAVALGVAVAAIRRSPPP